MKIPYKAGWRLPVLWSASTILFPHYSPVRQRPHRCIYTLKPSLSALLLQIFCITSFVSSQLRMNSMERCRLSYGWSVANITRSSPIIRIVKSNVVLEKRPLVVTYTLSYITSDGVFLIAGLVSIKPGSTEILGFVYAQSSLSGIKNGSVSPRWPRIRRGSR